MATSNDFQTFKHLSFLHFVPNVYRFVKSLKANSSIESVGFDQCVLALQNLSTFINTLLVLLCHRQLCDVG